jgi:sugar phosphate isomerase/epimerase
MRKSGIILTGIALLFVSITGCSTIQENKAEKNGWKLGAQTYTFNHFSLVQTFDKMQSLHLKYAEVYFGQLLGEGFDTAEVMDYHLKAEIRTKILELAKSKQVTIKACGVVVCDNKQEWLDLFQFARAMDIETITCEPTLEQLKFVDSLANVYNIDIAIHNHPKPSTYWNPDTLIAAIRDLGPHMGGCADVGHWERMGINPVEALKKYEGRLKSLHFKDVAPKSPLGEAAGEFEGQHDVIWGQGVCQVDSLLLELQRQNFKGLFSIEYEYNWDNSVPDVAACITYFNQQVDKLFQ